MASTAFAVYDAYTFRSEMAQDLSTLAAVIGNNSTAALAFNDEGSAEEMLGALAAKPHVVRACIYSAEGGVLAKYKRADVKEDFVPPAPQADGHGFAADHLTLFQGVVLDGENIGTVYLQSDLREVDIRVKRYAGIVGIVFVASCLVVFILSFRFQRVISDPILRLARTARAVSIEKNYSVRAMKNSGDELGLLIEAFNEMLTQIQERDAALQKARDGLELRVEERTRELQQEVAERRAAEEARRESEARHRDLVDNVPIGIYRTSVDGRILMVNPTLVRMLGFSSSEELVARNLEDEGFEPDYPRASFKAEIERHGEVKGLEAAWTRRDGSVVFVRENAKAVRGDDGEVAYYEGSVEDVTERKETEQRIVMLAHAIKSTNECVSITDLEDRLLFVNEAFQRTYGYGEDELIGKPITIVRSDKNAPGVVREINPATQEGHWQGEVQNRTKCGREFPVFLSTSLIRDETGRPFALIGVAQDITERKRAEMEMRRAKEDAEAATRAKSEFLANMSHEIRTPMNAIIGMTGLLLDTDLTPEQQDFAETIRSSSEGLLTIINDILDFSKIESGRLEIERHPFDLRGCLDAALDLFTEKAAGKGLDLACVLDEGVPDTVLGDDMRLRQILANLLGNAVKFTQKGEVVVSVTSRRLDSTDGHDPSAGNPQMHEVHFAVADTGIGIPDDRMGRLFQSFSQVDASTTRKYGGTGLGLAISKRLCELMGGSMWVESTPGKGSTFHFTVISESVAGQKRVYADGEHAVGRRSVRGSARRFPLRVLLAEDNVVNQKVALKILERMGYRADVAGDGLEVLEALRRQKYDVVLMDVQMPEMDGLQATRRIVQEAPNGNRPRIIAMTAHAMQGDREKCLDAGMDDYISKPINVEELQAALTRCKPPSDSASNLDSLVSPEDAVA